MSCCRCLNGKGVDTDLKLFWRSNGLRAAALFVPSLRGDGLPGREGVAGIDDDVGGREKLSIERRDRLCDACVGVALLVVVDGLCRLIIGDLNGFLRVAFAASTRRRLAEGMLGVFCDEAIVS